MYPWNWSKRGGALNRISKAKLPSAKKFVFFAVVLAVLTSALLVLRHALTDYAIVLGGYEPGIAATDLSALRAVMHPEDLGPTRSQLIEDKRLLTLDRGTRCIVLRWDRPPPWKCQGDHFPTQLKVLNGPWRDRMVWMCSDSFWQEALP